jgi:hypothetical protein
MEGNIEEEVYYGMAKKKEKNRAENISGYGGDSLSKSYRFT